jgi:hypothetical protein
LFVTLLLIQGLYYLVTGVWSLVDIDSFQMVTGPKTDLWLVRTVGVLITVIAVVLLFAAWRRQTTVEVALLAVGSALALTAIDVIYVALQVIAPIYLLDAVAELVLVACWAGLFVWRTQAGPARSPVLSPPARSQTV